MQKAWSSAAQVNKNNCVVPSGCRARLKCILGNSPSPPFFEEFHFKQENSPEKVLPPLEKLPPETANNSDLFAFPCFSVKY